MDRSLLVAAVALLAVSAGCAGLGSNATTADPTTTGSPPSETVTSTTAEPTQTQPAISAPGFNGGTLVDPLALADAHAAWLGGQSFTRVDNQTTRTAENTSRVATTIRVENKSRWATARTFTAAHSYTVSDGTIQQYANATHVYHRLDAGDGNVTYGVQPNTWATNTSPDSLELIEQRLGRDYVYDVFTTASWTTIVGETSGNGTTVYRVLGNASGETRFQRETVRNFTVEAGVTGDGFVQEMSVSYEHEDAVVSRTMSFSGVGETTVERPEWFDTAVDRTEQNWDSGA